VILMQKGRGGGLSGAFAGGMASGLLGSKTGDFLTWVTIVLVGVFLFLAVLLAKFYRPSLTGFTAEAPTTTQQPVSPGQAATPPSDAGGAAAPAELPSAPAPGASEAGAAPSTAGDANKTGG
jgi:preprotein translocase subunit SecG